MKGEFCDKSLSKSGDTVSGNGVLYCGDAQCSSVFKPFNLEGISNGPGEVQKRTS